MNTTGASIVFIYSKKRHSSWAVEIRRVELPAVGVTYCRLKRENLEPFTALSSQQRRS